MTHFLVGLGIGIAAGGALTYAYFSGKLKAIQNTIGAIESYASTEARALAAAITKHL
jgi:hypothetical protein